ncbi:MAG: hypothetical protein EZS28_001842 [Streblomastix strix]|uniref:Uncharacterized protein n=1 Tax=Streblomastix strix TaxID=222440 RepID=A0A5J4X5V5_9EUKA|nr:MAG: hypothetical protein EZS28_001842 [Streblomastix strix]
MKMVKMIVEFKKQKKIISTINVIMLMDRVMVLVQVIKQLWKYWEIKIMSNYTVGHLEELELQVLEEEDLIQSEFILVFYYQKCLKEENASYYEQIKISFYPTQFDDQDYIEESGVQKEIDEGGVQYLDIALYGEIIVLDSEQGVDAFVVCENNVNDYEFVDCNELL